MMRSRIETAGRPRIGKLWMAAALLALAAVAALALTVTARAETDAATFTSGPLSVTLDQEKLEVIEGQSVSFTVTLGLKGNPDFQKGDPNDTYPASLSLAPRDAGLFSVVSPDEPSLEESDINSITILNLRSQSDSVLRLDITFTAAQDNNWRDENAGLRIKWRGKDGAIDTAVKIKISEPPSNSDTLSIVTEFGVNGLWLDEGCSDWHSRQWTGQWSRYTCKRSETYTVSLVNAPRPKEPVIVEITSSNPEWVTVTPSKLVFKRSNWKRPRKVTATALLNNDDITKYLTISHRIKGIEKTKIKTRDGVKSGSQGVMAVTVKDHYSELDAGKHLLRHYRDNIADDERLKKGIVQYLNSKQTKAFAPQRLAYAAEMVREKAVTNDYPDPPFTFWIPIYFELPDRTPSPSGLPWIQAVLANKINGKKLKLEWGRVPGAEQYVVRYWVTGRHGTKKELRVNANEATITGLGPKKSYTAVVVPIIDGKLRPDLRSNAWVIREFVDRWLKQNQ